MSERPRPLDENTFGAEQLCFGCGPKNPIGLKLKFTLEADAVVTRYTPGDNQEGPPGIFHGGLQATLVDDLAGWTVVGLRERMGFTSSMQIRYLRPMRLGVEIIGRGKILKEADGMIVVDTVLEQGGKVGCTARVVYAIPDRDRAVEVLGELPPGWERFCR